MASIELNIPPGYVSAAYFIILEIIVMYIIDSALIHLTSALWYRRIYDGIPVEAKAAEIPGIAYSLVGDYLSLPNILAYTVKFVLLAIILLVDLQLISTSKIPLTYQLRTGTFEFNASESQWNNTLNFYRSVTRPFGNMRNCFNIYDNDTMNIFALTFNFDNNEIVESELVPTDSNPPTFKFPNQSTVQCMSHDFVNNSQLYVLVSVVGCSQLVETKCSSQMKYTLPQQIDLPFERSRPPIDIEFDEPRKLVSFTYEPYDPADVQQWWPSYNQPTLDCLRKSYQVPSANGGKLISNALSCVLVAKSEDNENTLIERWEYNGEERQFVRNFPGPLFKGIIDIGDTQKILILKNPSFQYATWASFSTQFVAEASIYRPLPNATDVIILGAPETRTQIPIYVVSIIVTLIVVTVVGRLVVRFTVEQDERPRINTVNGLSSIAREETEYSGTSLVQGRTASVGFTRAYGSEGHFGPISTNSVVIPRSAVKHVV